MKVGDRVKLVEHSRHPYGTSRRNPSEGSSYECVGIVTRIEPAPTVINIVVSWLNGETNGYNIDYLEVVHDYDYISIWDKEEDQYGI